MDRIDLVEATVEKTILQRITMLEAMLRVYLRENDLDIKDIELVQRTNLVRKEVSVFIRRRENGTK